MKHSGFTLVELLVVIAVSAVIMVGGFAYLGGYRSEQNLKLTSSEVLSAVKNTQQLSKSQQGGSRWGIHFSNSTSTQSYAVFSGTSFATGTVSRTYSLGRNVKFGNPGTSSTIDVLFNPSTGNPTQNQIISLNSGQTDGFVDDIIMNILGQITSKFDTGLVGYWHLDEGTATTTYDASGRGNIGTASSTSWSSICKAGNCLSLNGTNNTVQVPSSASLSVSGAITLAAWIKTSGTNNYSGLIHKSNSSNLGYQVGFDTGGKLRADFFNGISYGIMLNPTVVTDGNWHHIAATYDGSNGRLYVDGVSGTPGSCAGCVTVSTSTLIIGNDDCCGGRYFNGLIDEVRIYNRALSATEISDIYNSTR
jgi:prepilin-type N-terminal cleavage/methylation domain-containing protein